MTWNWLNKKLNSKTFSLEFTLTTNFFQRKWFQRLCRVSLLGEGFLQVVDFINGEESSLRESFLKEMNFLFYDICSLACLLSKEKLSKIYKGVEHLRLRILCKIDQDFFILTKFIIHSSMEQIQVYYLMEYTQVSSKIRTYWCLWYVGTFCASL